MDRRDRKDPENNEETGMFGRPEDAREALRGWAIVIVSATALFVATALFLEAGS